jgi:hypothetical protein
LTSPSVLATTAAISATSAARSRCMRTAASAWGRQSDDVASPGASSSGSRLRDPPRRVDEVDVAVTELDQRAAARSSTARTRVAP